MFDVDMEAVEEMDSYMSWQAKAEAAAEIWQATRDEIARHTSRGIRPNLATVSIERGDYRGNYGVAAGAVFDSEELWDMPACLLRRNGRPVDEVASEMGYEYIGEFVAEMAARYQRMVQTREELRRYERPTIHSERPELLALKREHFRLFALWKRMRRDGDAAWEHVRDEQRAVRREYTAACREVGVRAAGGQARKAEVA